MPKAAVEFRGVVLRAVPEVSNDAEKGLEGVQALVVERGDWPQVGPHRSAGRRGTVGL